MDVVTDVLMQTLLDWGVWGLFVASFLAGSVLPFGSELVFAGLLKIGLSPIACLVSATVGNTLGGMSCYYIGRLGKVEWMERYLGVRKQTVDRCTRFLEGKGALTGFFAFLPFVGEAVAVALGFMRSNVTITAASMLVGKGVRYAVILYLMT